MISQDDIDRGVVAFEDGRLSLMVFRHVRWRPFFVQYNSGPDECLWEYWAPSSKRWVIKGEMPRIGDTVCFRNKWPKPLFSQRGKVFSLYVTDPLWSCVDVSFPSGNHYKLDIKTLCIV